MVIFRILEDREVKINEEEMLAWKQRVVLAQVT